MRCIELKQVVTIIVAGMFSLAVNACSMSPEQEAAAIERGILESPGAEVLWATIKEEYPQDFAELIARVQALDNAERFNEQKTKEVGAQWLQDFFARITPDAVKAPQEELLTWSATEAELYQTLQRNAPAECAAMTMGQWLSLIHI